MKVSQVESRTSLLASENKRKLDLLYGKVQRLIQNFSLRDKIAFSGCQSQIEDSFLEIINADPMKFVSEAGIDEVRLKETYKSSAR